MSRTLLPIEEKDIATFSAASRKIGNRFTAANPRLCCDVSERRTREADRNANGAGPGRLIPHTLNNSLAISVKVVL